MEKQEAESILQYILHNYMNGDHITKFVKTNPIGKFEFDNIEYNIIAGIFYYRDDEKTNKYCEEWCKNPNTDSRILEIICAHSDRYCIRHFNFNKTISPMSFATYWDLVLVYVGYNLEFDKVSDEIADHLIRWYEPFAKTGILHMQCVNLKQFKFYKKIPYDFDPFDGMRDKETFPPIDYEYESYNYDEIKKSLADPEKYSEVYHFNENFKKFMNEIKEEDIPTFFEFCKKINDEAFVTLMDDIPLKLYFRIKELLLVRQFVISQLVSTFMDINFEILKPEIVLFIRDNFPNHKPYIEHRVVLSKDKTFIKRFFPDYSKKDLDRVMDNLEKAMK